MIPSNKSFNVINVSNGVPAKVIALKLPDDVTKVINQLPDSDLRIQFNPSNPAENKLFLGKGTILQFNISPESQSVDVARSSIQKGTIQLVGRVKEKMAIKQELAFEKANSIRLQSQLAEKERLSRRTVTLEEQPKSATRRVAVPSASVSTTRSRLMQRITKTKKVATVAASPRSTAPTSRKPEPSSYDKVEHSSTQSWSPPIDVFSKPMEPTKPLNSISKKSNSLDSVRKNVVVPPIERLGSVPPPFRSPNQEMMEKLQSELKLKSVDYDRLEKWIDNRLAIFVQLQKDLATASGNQAATDKITHRVAVETKNLEADKEYKWKRIELDQLQLKLEGLREEISKLEK